MEQVEIAVGGGLTFRARVAGPDDGRLVLPLPGPYRFVEFDGASHWIPETAPEQFTRHLLEHFETHH